MALPSSLLRRFPPSPTALLDLVRKHVDELMLLNIANADYGIGANEALKGLRHIRQTGLIPADAGFALFEVLHLTRWSDPERSEPPPFVPEPTGRRGHITRMFVCAALLYAAAEPTLQIEDIAAEDTLTLCLVSAGVLGDDFNEALACFLNWRLQYSEEPLLVTLTLLTCIIRVRSYNLSETELRGLTELVLEEENRFSKGCQEWNTEGYPVPLPFSLEREVWRSVALELKERAATLYDPATRENVELCVLLLERGW